DFKELLKQGAVIVDVRTKQEFNQGQIKKSVNIPLESIQSELKKLNKNKPVITCCASRIRNWSANNQLKTNGFTEVYNGGDWMVLNNKIKK
ncbi:MAG: rhodanese-like domain-containing protein, partial [Flavobacteriaceae bacterium]|nr:rhodanese-like domain-containing protein [Flavobacteriaceae bacterium]